VSCVTASLLAIIMSSHNRAKHDCGLLYSIGALRCQLCIKQLYQSRCSLGCWGSRKPRIRWGAHWRHMANTTEPSACGADAAYVKSLWPLLNDLRTLPVFGVGRSTVGRGPGGGSRTCRVPTTTARSLSVAADSSPEADPIVRWRRGHKRHVSHSVRGPLLGISGCFPHPSNYLGWTNSTSGLGLVPHTKHWLIPAYKVQWFQLFAVIFAHFPGISQVTRIFALQKGRVDASWTPL